MNDHEPAPSHRGRGRLAPGGRALALLLVLALVVAGIWLYQRARDRNRFATKRFTNEAAGYSFAYPPSWTLTTDGNTSKLVNPARSVVVTFGLVATSSAEQASAALLRQIRGNYSGVSVVGTERQSVNGNPAIIVAGTGTSRTRVSLRFLAITVQGPERTYAITAFTAAGADPKVVVPVLNEIVGSFEP